MAGVLLTALFVALNGFFVAAEFALVKLRATQIQRLKQNESAAARATVEICQRLDRYLSATQLGITLASIGLGSYAEPIVAHSLELIGARVGLHGRIPHQLGHALAFAALTFAHILFGELLPKLIAISSAERMALAAARPLKLFYWISLPALVLLNGMSRVLLRAMGFPSLQDAEGALSEEEILYVLAQAYARGRLSDAKRVLLERVMRFSDGVARQVMVPRPDVVSIDASETVERALARVQETGFTRYPVVENGNLDRVVGYVNVKDLTRVSDGAQSIRKPMREAVLVPETVGLFELMQDMQRRQTPIAIVVDEYGGTSGIATLEDVIEEIVGEIRDEHDEEAPRVVARPDGTVVADGLAPVHELRAHGIDLGETSNDTVGGTVLDALGRLARHGDEVRIGDYILRVDSVRRRRVGRVVIRKRPRTVVPPA